MSSSTTKPTLYKATLATQGNSLPGAKPGGSSALNSQPGLTGWYRFVEDTADFDLTLFVACYNEEQNILATLENLRSTMLQVPLTYEIIVIDDGSRDRSGELVLKYSGDHPEMNIRLIRNSRNRGLSYNFVEGAFLGRGRCYKLVCGDNVDSPESLMATFQEVGQADVIIPFHAEIQGRSIFRKVLSRTYTRIVNFLSGHRLRYYNGCAVYHRADVMRWHSRSSGFGFQAELVTKLLNEGATFIEVPIVGQERQGGSSSALKLRNWISVGKTLFLIFVWRLRRRVHR